MTNPPLIEILCPQCKIDVQPIKAAGAWFCPHCAWQFTQEEIERELQRQKRDRDAPPNSESPDT